MYKIVFNGTKFVYCQVSTHGVAVNPADQGYIDEYMKIESCDTEEQAQDLCRDLNTILEIHRRTSVK